MSCEDPRFWVRAIDQSLGKILPGGFDVEDMGESDLEKIRDAYEEMGGSWYSMASGDPMSWALLRKVCKEWVKMHREKE